MPSVSRTVLRAREARPVRRSAVCVVRTGGQPASTVLPGGGHWKVR